MNILQATLKDLFPSPLGVIFSLISLGYDVHPLDHIGFRLLSELYSLLCIKEKGGVKKNKKIGFRLLSELYSLL